NLDVDIARREVDIGVRNRRPDQPWLAGQRTGSVAYASYGRDPGVTGWITASRRDVATPSARWIMDHHGSDVVTAVNDPRLGVAMARAGVGRVILPTFAGDGLPGIVRLSAPIEELASEEWLVSHHEGRHDPAVRQALTALSRFLTLRRREEGKP
ncbi:MAG: LysR family transcriptional regulator, partial [Pseudomonadota bacterium]